MQNLTKTQFLSLIVGVISAMAGLISTLGTIWGFTAIASQVSETCFAVSGFANIVFFGITVQKAKTNSVLENTLSDVSVDATVTATTPVKPTNIDGVIR